MYPDKNEMPKAPQKTEGKLAGSKKDQRIKKPLDKMTTKEIGAEGERIVASFFEKRGFTILERNWRCKVGEADFIVEDPETPNTVVLVEVKTRLSLGEGPMGMPELAVNEAKQKKYRSLALMYLALHPEVESVRFDVIAITIVDNSVAKLRHLIGAFAWDE